MLHNSTDHTPLPFKPWAHQIEAEAFINARPYGGLFMEPRTGKSRVILLNSERLWRSELRTLVIFAPNGVHRNWVTDELPRWLTIPWQALVWRSGKAGQRTFKKAVDELTASKALAVLAVNIDAIHNPKLAPVIAALLKRGKAMAVIDESADIAHASSRRTKAAIKWRDAFAWRRILDGTPTAESPLEAYAQCEFLSRAALGFGSYYAFRARYAVLKRTQLGGRLATCARCNGAGCQNCGHTGQYMAGARSFDTVVGYRNEDELKAKLARFCYVVKRADCADLPPKVIARRPFALGTEQRRVYDELKKEYVSQLSDGRAVTAGMVLTRYIRLQQVAHNFWPAQEEAAVHGACGGQGCDLCDGGFTFIERPLVHIDKDNPRLEALLAELKRLPGQVTIWTRFLQDADDICSALGSSGRYDGSVGEAQRAETRDLYRRGDLRYLVGSPAAGGRGLDFSHADAMIFYGHNFRVRLRQQAEDRGESLSRKVSTSICDLVAEDTVDEYILECSRKKIERAEFMLDWKGVLG